MFSTVLYVNYFLGSTRFSVHYEQLGNIITNNIPYKKTNTFQKTPTKDLHVQKTLQKLSVGLNEVG